MKILLILIAAAVLILVSAMLVFVYVIQNVEQPAYRVVEQDGALEVRDYPPLVVAEVRRGGSRQQGLRAGFGPLARYIFAKERGGEKVAMTAPVVQQAIQADERIAMTAPVVQTADAEGGWAVRFIMPSRYHLEDLPPPAAGDVQLRETPPRRLAAVRFSGRSTDALIAEQEQRLRSWMAERGLEPHGAPLYAYYNDPLTPGPLRRNEVMIEVRRAR